MQALIALCSVCIFGLVSFCQQSTASIQPPIWFLTELGIRSTKAFPIELGETTSKSVHPNIQPYHPSQASID